MANIRISQLPTAPTAITGSELIPIVQNGQTVQTTVGAIVNSPVQTQTFLTVGNQPTLPNSRAITTGLGLGNSDGGAQGAYQIFLNASSASLENVGNGMLAKSGTNTISARTISAGTSGLSVANGDGVSGDPTISTTGLLTLLAGTVGTGLLATAGGTTLTPVTITGDANEISVTNGNTSPVIGLADNPIVPGTAGMVIPFGTTAERALTPANGEIRYNTSTNQYEGYQNGAWAAIGTGSGTVTLVSGTADQIDVANGSTTPVISIASDPTIPGLQGAVLPKGNTGDRNPSPVTGEIRYNTTTNAFEGYLPSGWSDFAVTAAVTSFSAGSTGLTPSTSQTGAIILAGTLNVNSGGTGATTLTGYVIGNGTSAFTASATIPTTDLSGTVSNAQLANSSVTYNGVTVALGASGTITASNPNALTAGTGLSGGTYDGSSAVTFTIDSTVATLTGSQTLTNKTISGASNTLSNIGNSSLTNSAITINGSSVSLGGSVTVTATATNALTIGTGLSGTSYNGSSAVTIAIDSTVATLTGSQTLTNKTISGSSNTLTNIANGSLTNSSVTIGSSSLSLGGTLTTLAGVTISGATNTLSNIGNSSLTNSTVTIGTTSISLGSSSLTLGGLTSVTVTQDPTAALDLATKQYVDSVAQGLDAKASCVYGTTANITLSGLATQAGGDWATTLTASDRILVKNQSSSQFNGIYLANASTWTRALDMSVWAEVPSSFVFIETGTTLADTGWVTTANAGGTIDVTAMPWVQFSGAGTYTAGTGLTLTGTQFSLTAPVTVALGGTGATTALTQYGVVYGSTTSAMATTSAGTSTQVLHGNASGAPTFSAVSLTADVSGVLPIANGGTNSTATATAGGIGYGTGTAHAYTVAGTSGQPLISAGASAPAFGTLALGTANTNVSGALTVTNGGTGVATLTGLAYGNGTSAFTAATAAQVVAVISTTAVTNATNATNLALTAGSGATNYLTYAATATGNVPQFTSTGLTYNATNNAITGGISGGAF